MKKQKINDKEVLRLFDSGLPARDITKQLKTSYTRIRTILDKNYPSRLKHYQDIDLTSEEKEIIFGSLLGDACIVDHSISQKTSHIVWAYSTFGYANFLFQKLRRLCNQKQIKTIHRMNIKKKGRKATYYDFDTKCLISLKKIEKIVGIRTGLKVRKTINKKWLEQLTPLSLAIWFMDDGYTDGVTMTYCTHSFTFKEHLLLKKYFKNKWNIKTKIISNKQQGYRTYYLLCIDINSIDRFIDLIKPFIISSMNYKLLRKMSSLICSCCGKRFMVLRGSYKRKQRKNTFIRCDNPECTKTIRYYAKYKYKAKRKKIKVLDFELWKKSRNNLWH